MILEEVIRLEGIKLLDTNAFECLSDDFSETIYECEGTEQIPPEVLVRGIELKQKGIDSLLLPDVYTISEVAIEKEKFLEIVNGFVDFHSQRTSFHPIKEWNPYLRDKRKKFARQRKNRDDEEVEYEISSMHQLRAFAGTLHRLIKALRQKDARDTFSREEMQKYESFLAYFLSVTKRHNLKYDSPKKYLLKGRNKNNLLTDEKLVATALTLADRERVVLISTDSDTVAMVNFFQLDTHDKKRYRIFSPKNEVVVYSNFSNKGYEIKSYLSPEQLEVK